LTTRLVRAESSLKRSTPPKEGNHGKDGLSAAGWDFIGRILASAMDLCLVLNSSVNSYSRLDPHFEAPNQGLGHRPRLHGAHPLGNERSARVEVRSIAPDANPYLAIYTLLKTGLEGPQSEEETDKRPRTRFLPDNIYDAIRLFKGSRFMQEAMGEEVHAKP
jgi:glutamine synthetase